MNRTQTITVKALFLGSMQVILLICAVLQLCIDSHYENLLPTAMVVVTSSLMVQYLRVSAAMTTHPVSSLALIGLTVSSQFGALLTQTLDGEAFTHLLRAPVLTFSMLASVHLVAIGSHWVYRHFSPLNDTSRFIANKVVSPMGGHAIPPVLVVWILGLIGLGATASGNGNFGDVGGKFIAGLFFLVWMPFLIPIYTGIQGQRYADMKKQLPMIVLFAAVIVAIALIKNFRAMMFVGPFQLAMVYLMHTCMVPTPVTRKMLKSVVGLILVLALAVSSLSDLMMAMEIARAKRETAKPKEVLEETYKNFNDKDMLSRYRQTKEMASVLQLYDENYLHNPMLARFTETKFHDNMMYFADRMNDSERDEIIYNLGVRLVSILPQNVLDLLEIKLKKEKYVYSMGDLYLSLQTGGNLGSYVTGSIWADCYVVAGAWFPVLVSVLMTLIFMVLDALGRFGPGLYISPVVTCTVWHIYLYGMGGDSLSFKVTQLVRDLPQKVILYTLCLFLVTALLKLLGLRMAATSVQQTPASLTP
jgi:hypothetical protein